MNSSIEKDETKKVHSSLKEKKCNSFDCNNNKIFKCTELTLSGEKSLTYKHYIPASDKLSSRVNKNRLTCKSDLPSKYNLRTKSIQNRIDIIRKQQLEKKTKEARSKQPKTKTRNSPLSRYRRKNANARERNRIQEINAAFEKLKDILPKNYVDQSSGDKKLTKIATLRNAAIYIKILSKLANQTNDEKFDFQSLPSSDSLEDALPDLSFISSTELSVLLQIENEENELPNKLIVNSNTSSKASSNYEMETNKVETFEYCSTANQLNLDLHQSYSQQVQQQPTQHLNQFTSSFPNVPTSVHQNVLCQTYTQNKNNFIQFNNIQNQYQVNSSMPLSNHAPLKLHSTSINKLSSIEPTSLTPLINCGGQGTKLFSNSLTNSSFNETLILQTNIDNVNFDKLNQYNTDCIIKNLNDCSSDSLNDQSDSYLSIESDLSNNYYLSPELNLSPNTQDLF